MTMPHVMIQVSNDQSGHPPVTRVEGEAPPVSPTPIPGEVMSTWMDSWTFCKATAKSLGSYHWVPWMGAASAVISALTATTVFASLDGDQASTTSKAVVGSVAALVAVLAALQSWTSSRVKALVGQMNAFDRLHRRIERDIENHSRPASSDEYVSLDAEYAGEVRKQYLDLVSGMAQVSNRHWDRAKEDVLHEMHDELRRFGYAGYGRA